VPADLITIIIYGIIVSAVSFLLVYIITPLMIKFLLRNGKTVQDYHKLNRPQIPRPAGPILLLGIVVTGILLYILLPDIKIIAILSTTIIAFVVGYVDDIKVMPGWFKPVALIAAGLPLVLLGAHSEHLNLIFGTSFIPILYIPLILLIIPIVGNTINSIDVFNGVVTGFLLISMVPLLISIAIFGSIDVFLTGLILFFGTLALYKFHRFPSKIFPGDSGTLLLGAMYGALSIAGNSEIIGVIALLPAVMNSFLFLSSVKKIVEHREIKSRPVTIGKELKLKASADKNAPSTLVRIILAKEPLSEYDIIKKIFKLAIFSSALAFISIIMQYYFTIGIILI
jgi:UDP-N-acetylglucosamine--dolichyl-phosphate N-acetylglucosaminephosphotransferase